MSAERRVELVLPHARSAELRQWAANCTEANPIAWDFVHGIEMWVTDEPFMGVELTFVTQTGSEHPRELFTLALFASIPDEEEKRIMNDEVES